MIPGRVYDNNNLIALQPLDTYDFESCEFSTKFRSKTKGYGKTNDLSDIMFFLQSKELNTFILKKIKVSYARYETLLHILPLIPSDKF